MVWTKLGRGGLMVKAWVCGCWQMKEALKSRREKNRQRLLELQHEVGIQSSELIFQVTTHRAPETDQGKGKAAAGLALMQSTS